MFGESLVNLYKIWVVILITNKSEWVLSNETLGIIPLFVRSVNKTLSLDGN